MAPVASGDGVNCPGRDELDIPPEASGASSVLLLCRPGLGGCVPSLLHSRYLETSCQSGAHDTKTRLAQGKKHLSLRRGSLPQKPRRLTPLYV